MKIPTLRPGSGPEGSRRRKETDNRGAEFADVLREAAGHREGAGVAAAATGAADAVLTLQAVGDSGEERNHRRAMDRGEDLLDKLNELRLAILVGAVPKDRLAALAQAVRARQRDTTDPRLAEILAEIELRAEVEIAKLTRAE